jgi:prevent-host-death family protein
VVKEAAQALTEGRYSVRLVHEVQVMSRKVTTLGVGAAREKLAGVLNRVIFGGERVVLTRHRRPVAAVVSVLDLEPLGQGPRGATSCPGRPESTWGPEVDKEHRA